MQVDLHNSRKMGGLSKSVFRILCVLCSVFLFYSCLLA